MNTLQRSLSNIYKDSYRCLRILSYSTITTSESSSTTSQSQSHSSSISNINSTSMSSPLYFKVTQIRSAIGLPEKTSRILKSLGLGKRMKTVYHIQTPETMGRILKVKELVKVESNIETLPDPQELRKARQPPSGYNVNGSML